MGSIQSHQDLIVWQKVMDLAAEGYRLSKLFPKAEEYRLTSQILRAATSVPAKRSSTIPLSRALREVAALPTRHAGRYWIGLDEWAASNPVLREAEATHDRTLSLPSELFYEPDTRYAAGLAETIASTVMKVLT